MKKTTTIALAALLFFAACDKIDPEEYTVYDGAVITWSAGSAELQPIQRTLVEKFTGPRCNNCPTADITLDGLHDQWGDRLVLIAVNHPKGQGMPYPNEPDLRTDGGTAWDEYYGITAIPSAFINRDKGTRFEGEMSNIAAALDNAMQRQPIVALEAAATGESQINLSIDLQFIQSHTSDMTLTVAIVEDSLEYKQLLPDGTVDPDYSHNHMLRKVVTSFWGRDVEATGTAGQKVHGTMSFNLPEDCIATNCHIVVFLSDKSTRQVINSVACHIQ